MAGIIRMPAGMNFAQAAAFARNPGRLHRKRSPFAEVYMCDEIGPACAAPRVRRKRGERRAHAAIVALNHPAY